MRRISNRKRALIAGAVLSLGVATTTWAGVPGSDGVISACYTTATGGLRVIDAENLQRCNVAKETRITWNQQGEPGPAGPAGPQGPQGDPAPAASVYTADGNVDLTGANHRTVATLNLPAGKFQLSGKAMARNGAPTPSFVACNVMASSTQTNVDTSSSTVMPNVSGQDPTWAVLPYSGTFTLPAASTVRVDCIGKNGVHAVAKLVATTVGSIQVQP